jgi:nucleotidyltransferase substrate binding protein (TIGR01987 family)
MRKLIKLDGSQSFTNLKKAYASLQRSLSTPVTEPRDLSGIIKDFEMVYELSWKVLKRRLADDGTSTQGPKDVFTKAYQLGYIADEERWLGMIADRNQANHVYDEAQARTIVDRVRQTYADLFTATFDMA